MASSPDWYNEKVTNLLQEDLRVSTLGELKDRLSLLPHDDAASISNVLQLGLIFDCLNDTNQEQIGLACDVLTLCLSNLTLGESTTRYGIALERSLIHPYSAVKLMALKEIKRSLTNDETCEALCAKNTIICNLITCIKDKDLSVAKEAMHIMNKIGITKTGIEKLTSKSILNFLQDNMGGSEVYRLRFYQLLVDISKQSEDSMLELMKVGLMEKILLELDTTDELLQVNIIELLTNLAQVRHGHTFLYANKVLEKLCKNYSSTQFCYIGILKLFGTIAHMTPVYVMNTFPEVFEQFLCNLENADTTVYGVTLETISFVAHTAQGKKVFRSMDVQMDNAVKTISSKLGSVSTEIQIKSLNCLESLVRNVEGEAEVDAVTQHWFDLIDGDPMQVVLKYAKNPFEDIRLAGLGIVHAIAGQKWGQEYIKNTAGLAEFLLDRSNESSKECKIMKYEIIKLLASSMVFDNSTLERFQKFVKDGTFYVHANMQVEVDGNE